MSFLIGVGGVSSLVQYNQAATALPYQVPVVQTNQNARNSTVGLVNAQPVQPILPQPPATNSLNAALSAGLLQSNPNAVGESQGAKGTSNNGLLPVSLGDASSAIAKGETYKYYNTANQVDSLNTSSIYSPVTPIYNFPKSYLESAYTSNVRQTAPSTFSDAQKQNYTRAMHSYGAA